MAGNRRKSLNNKNKIVCLQCKTEVLESDDALQCDVCNKTLHSVCTKMDKRKIDKLLDNSSLAYKCHFCEPNDDNALVSELTEIKTKLNQLDNIRETIQFMSSQYDAILKGVAKNTKQIETLKKENKNLRDEVKQLKSSVKYLNYVRVQNDCIVNGVTVEGASNALSVVLDIAKKTGADVCEDDIEDAYFLPNRNKKSDKKSMVVKFLNKKSKKVFMNEKVKMKEIDDLKSVYVNDFLSKETMDVFNYAKSLKDVGFKLVFARGGNVFAKKDVQARLIPIKSMDDVDQLLIKSSGGGKKNNHSNEVLSIASDDDSENDDGNNSFNSFNNN